MGRPVERVLRQTVIAMRLADIAGVAPEVSAATYYTSLLTWVACATDTSELARAVRRRDNALRRLARRRPGRHDDGRVRRPPPRARQLAPAPHRHGRQVRRVGRPLGAAGDGVALPVGERARAPARPRRRRVRAADPGVRAVGRQGRARPRAARASWRRRSASSSSPTASRRSTTPEASTPRSRSPRAGAGRSSTRIWSTTSARNPRPCSTGSVPSRRGTR